MQVTKIVTVTPSLAEVFAYLSDFTTTNEWDPGTVRTTRQSGDGGVGTRYHNVSTFLGRQTELTYVVTEHDAPTRFALRGENKSVVARDRMTFAAAPDGGTQVTYHAELAFKGLARLFSPVAAIAFRRLGDRAADGLRSALGGRRS